MGKSRRYQTTTIVILVFLAAFRLEGETGSLPEASGPSRNPLPLPVVDGRNYGLKGDGSDETAAMQSAIDAAANKILFLEPNRTYTLNSPIRIPNSVTIIGHKTVFDLGKIAKGAAVTISSLGSASETAANGYIEGVFFKGSSSAGVVGISFTDPMSNATADYTIRNCRIGLFETCIQVDRYAWCINFEACNIGNWTSPPHNKAGSVGFKILKGALVAGERISFLNCTFQGLERAVYAEQGTIFLTNCSVDYCDVAAEANGIARVHFTGCHIESNFDGYWFRLRDSGKGVLSDGLNGASAIFLSNCTLWPAGNYAHSYVEMDDDFKKFVMTNVGIAYPYGQTWTEPFIIFTDHDNGLGRGVRVQGLMVGDSEDWPVLGAPSDIHNGGFESPDLAGWTGALDGGTVTLDSLRFRTGRRGAALTPGDRGTTSLMQRINAKGPAYIAVMYHVRSSDGNLDGKAEQGRLDLEYRSQDNTLVQSQTWPMGNVGPSYERRKVTGFAPPGTDHIILRFSVTAGASRRPTLVIDDVLVNAF